MVLDHVAERPDVVVVVPATLDPDRLRHRDLHVVDAVPVPQGLEDRVREPEGEQVLDGLLAQVVVNPVDLSFVEVGMDSRVELSGGREVQPERLLDHESCPSSPPVESAPPDLLHRRGKCVGGRAR